jgi:hypothetical protein
MVLDGLQNTQQIAGMSTSVGDHPIDELTLSCIRGPV